MTVTDPVDLAQRLQSWRFPIADESLFQMCVAEVLERNGVEAEREYDLGPGRGRIDFYVHAFKVGLELKVKGSPSDVARQLLRYATSPEIDTLILVTGRARLGVLPATLGGKRLLIMSVWRSLL